MTSFKEDGAGLIYIEKDPAAVLDYIVDLTAWLAGETLAAVSWSVSPGLAIQAQSNTATRATIRLAGGAAGADYSVKCQFTTNTGQSDERTFYIRSVER